MVAHWNPAGPAVPEQATQWAGASVPAEGGVDDGAPVAGDGAPVVRGALGALVGDAFPADPLEQAAARAATAARAGMAVLRSDLVVHICR